MAASVSERKVSLNDGRQMPIIGLGTFLSAPNEVGDAVIEGWKAGVRHIDCAQLYGNEKEIGVALKELSSNPNYRRKEMWITGKVWNTHHRTDLVEKALEQTLKDLGVDYLDLYLIHWPVSFEPVEDPSQPGVLLLLPERNGVVLLDKSLRLVETWRAFINLQKLGKVKSIGVSNCSIDQMEKLMKATGVTPAVNQVEAHPFLPQQDLVDWGERNNVHISAYMPFGGDPGRGGTKVLGNPVVQEVAKRCGKDPGQVLGSWGIKHGLSVLPKSVKSARIRSNLQVFDLDDESYQKLRELGRENPTHFTGIPYSFKPSWEVNVFDTPEEQGLFDPLIV